jgi:ribosomal protein S18 acetylase RimI-like enzyme
VIALHIRTAVFEDAPAYLAMLKQLDNETDMMLYEPDERPDTVESIEKTILAATASGSLILVAEDKDVIVGFLTAERGFARRIHHSAYIVVGILASQRGQGLGKKLFTDLENWAKNNQITKLELTVSVRNEPGIRLYKSMGFAVEGIKKDSLKLNGKLVDEYYMGKIVPL